MSENALIQNLMAEHPAPSIPPTLYHGTVRARARRMVEGGLLPRKSLSVATVNSAMGSEHAWLASSRDCVYLSDIVAPYYALVASCFLGAEPAVVGVRVHDMDSLRPDEDFLASALWHSRHGRAPTQGVQVEAVRRLDEFSDLWSASLARLAAVSHHGAVTADNVVSARTVSLSDHERIALISAVTPAMPGAFRDPARFGCSEAIKRVHGSLLRWCHGGKAAVDDVLSLSGAVDSRTRYSVESALDKRWTEMKLWRSAPALMSA